MSVPVPDWADQAASAILVRTDRTQKAMAQVIAEVHSRETQILTCVYCGHAYPPGTPASQHEALTAHIKVCEKHPLGVVRRALVGLVGAETKEELDAMEAVIRLTPAPAADKVGIIDAIHALIATL